jgi:hypothetical protein
MKNRAAELTLRLRGALDGGFYRQAAKQLERVLRRSTSSVTLHIEDFQEKHRPQFQQLLQRLSRYGDRIRITVDRKVRDLVEIDSSGFVLGFEG